MRSQNHPHRFKSSATSPAVAYRKDVEKRKGPIGKDDGSWIVISTIVSEVGHAHGADRRRLLDEAAKMASQLFDSESLAYGCAFDPPSVDRKSSIAVLRLLAERMEYAGTLNLATSLLESLGRVLPVESVNAGRVLAQRARLSWKMSKTDLALARYQHLRRTARNVESNELLVRAWAGFAALAQLRGNYPEVRKWANRLVVVSQRCAYTRLSALGHQGFMVSEAAAGHYAAAIPHGWASFQCQIGNSRGQSEALNNIAQLFYLSGRPIIARDAFGRVLTARPPAHVAVAALGGYALSSAALADERAVRWAAAEAASLSDVPGQKYELANTLIECASALDTVGDHPYASVLRARAATMAQYAGFFELMHKVEEAARRVPAPAGEALRDAETDVVNAILNLRWLALPDCLELAPV